MGVTHSEYWVRVKVKYDGDSDVNTYHVAMRLAADLAHDYPGLTFEVAEDKVWATVTRRNDA